MEEYIVQGSLGLTRGSLLRIEDGRHILVYVWEGEIWLTEEGENRDHLLKPGQWHRVQRRGSALAYALARSVVTLTAPEPEYYAGRIVLCRAGTLDEVELYSANRARMPWLALAAARLRRLWSDLLAPASRRSGAVP